MGQKIYRHFDDKAWDLAIKCLLEAEELIRKEFGISEKDWQTDYKNKHILVRASDKDIEEIEKINRTVRERDRSRIILGYIKQLDEVWEIIEIDTAGRAIYLKDKKGLFFQIILNEDSLMKIYEANGEEAFIKATRYVFVHELLHMLHFINIRKLERNWEEENKTHRQTIKIVGYRLSEYLGDVYGGNI